MSNGTSASSGSATDPLKRDVSTGQDNPVATVPFSVLSLTAGDKNGKWDVSKGSLRVEYRISDQNGMAQSGRIVYYVKTKSATGGGTAGGDETVVHTQALQAGDIKPGKSHVLTKWDGTISEGLKDRNGKKMTADLSPLGVRVEIWNQATAAPGTSTGDGKTDVDGEYVSSKDAQATIDVIGDAKWERHRCIPFIMDLQHPDLKAYKNYEPELGVTKLESRVNVAEGTAVRIAVCRIVDINDPSKDELYARTPTDKEYNEKEPEELQLGLWDAKVDKSGRVLLSNNDPPYIEWKHYAKHWEKDGENYFYCFKLAFGKEGMPPKGEYMVASERDYSDKTKRKKCLHMRFTVFILASATNLPGSRAEAQRLHGFFRNTTEYYRSYILTKAAEDLEQFVKIFKNRYIVIISGHAACGCVHASHAKITIKGKGTAKDREVVRPVPRENFPPDQDLCPNDKDGNPFEDKKKKYYGCGNRLEVTHQIILGSVGKRKMIMVVLPDSEKTSGILVGLRKSQATDPTMVEKLGSKDLPKLMFYAASCLSILTTRLAEEFTKKGQTQYYVGHTYVSGDDNNLCEVFFQHWFKAGKDSAPTQFDQTQLIKSFTTVANYPKHKKDHPRITDQSLALNAKEGPTRVGDFPAPSPKAAMT